MTETIPHVQMQRAGRNTLERGLGIKWWKLIGLTQRDINRRRLAARLKRRRKERALNRADNLLQTLKMVQRNIWFTEILVDKAIEIAEENLDRLDPLRLRAREVQVPDTPPAAEIVQPSPRATHSPVKEEEFSHDSLPSDYSGYSTPEREQSGPNIVWQRSL